VLRSSAGGSPPGAPGSKEMSPKKPVRVPRDRSVSTPFLVTKKIARSKDATQTPAEAGTERQPDKMN
jgi:hypothetical protein